MGTPFVIGIDLGTSNCALTFTDLQQPEFKILEISQIFSPNVIDNRATLPSALYLERPDEFPEGSLALPWQNERHHGVIGAFARNHGALVPDRLVVSAKSWLSNTHIDPRSAVLPWQSDIEEKVSAVEASRRFLEHLKADFLYQNPDRSLEDGTIVITVPASFHEVARQLTLEAAEAAGLAKVILLEEPQAAFYAWVAAIGEAWRDHVAPGDVLLVCDIGGGTSDFSLIAVTEQDDQLGLERISVGEHLLLGGDNMDLALAYVMQAQLAEEGHEIDAWQLQALVHACRAAKVRFFQDPELTELSVAVPSRGSSLLAETLSATLTRGAVENMVLDGFFPLTSVDDHPAPQAAGLQELGLPYASDPVISKHLARFLCRSLENVRNSAELTKLLASKPETTEGAFLRPSGILFNGGVFNATPIRQRVLDLLARWNDGQPIRELPGYQPDLAVALGACQYGYIRETGQGIRIKAGTPRSYYVGLESAMPAVPGFKTPIKALCVVPQGMEEGTELLIDDQEFGLMVGQPAEFRFFSSEVRSGDEAGAIVRDAEKQLDESAFLNVTLSPSQGMPAGQAIPVVVNAVVTELGNLELWMQHRPSGERWKFELEVRGE